MTAARPNFEHRLAASWPPVDWLDVTVLVAVSGGPDSVSLLRGLCAIQAGPAQGRIVVGHFNHHLRAASDEDERFVARLCNELQLECRVGHAAARATASTPLEVSHGGQSLEAILRVERYEFLQQAAEQAGARYVVAAHTADDQAETILHRILRGTGLAGLAGMRRARPLGIAVGLIRPLLELRRRDVLEYLDELQQPYRRDETNDDSRFTRSRIRHQLLPTLEQDYNAQVRDALLRLGKLAGEAAGVLESLACQRAERTVSVSREEGLVVVEVSLDALRSEPDCLRREVLRQAWRAAGWPEANMGYHEWEELAALAAPTAPANSRRTFPGEVDVLRTSRALEMRGREPEIPARD